MCLLETTVSHELIIMYFVPKLRQDKEHNCDDDYDNDSHTKSVIACRCLFPDTSALCLIQ